MRTRLWRAALALVSAGAAVALSAAAAQGDDPPVAYQIDVGHSGVQWGALPLVQHWQVTLPAQPSYPLIAHGRVYVTVGDNSSPAKRLLALDRVDGHVVWSQPLVGARPWSAPAYDAGVVFVVENNSTCCSSGLMSAFSAFSGALLWTTQLPGQYLFSSPPTAANGVVYTGGAGSGGTLYAVDEATGGVLASQGVENGDHSSPALSANGVFVSYACDQAYGFAPKTLAPLWHYSGPCEGGGGKTPVYANGQVFIRDFFGNLILDAGTGSVIRSFAPEGASIPAPAVDSSTIFLLTGSQLTAQDRATGAVKWTFSGDGQLTSAPIVIMDSTREWVFEGSSSGRLYGVDAATGSAVWTAQLPAGIPAPDEQNLSQPLSGLSAGQLLLVVPAGNTLTAFGPETGTPCPTRGTVSTRWHYSANGSSGKWSTAKATDCSTGNVTNGPQAMEGDLKVNPGTAIKTGYDLQLPGNKVQYKAVVTNPTVVFQLRCVSGAPASPSTLTVAMLQQSYTVKGSEWEPTGDQKSSLGYQGSGTVPDACQGSRVRLDKGGTFSATVMLH